MTAKTDTYPFNPGRSPFAGTFSTTGPEGINHSWRSGAQLADGGDVGARLPRQRAWWRARARGRRVSDACMRPGELGAGVPRAAQLTHALGALVHCFGQWLRACLARFVRDCRRIVALCVDARREDKGVFHPLNIFYCSQMCYHSPLAMRIVGQSYVPRVGTGPFGRSVSETVLKPATPPYERASEHKY